MRGLRIWSNRATVAQSSAKVTWAATRRPRSTTGIQYLASSHMPSIGSASTANQRGTTSSDSATWPAKSAVQKTSAVWSQAGLKGNANSRRAR